MEKQIVFEGRKLFYRITGTGKPVILLHGFGETGSVWDDQVAYLSSQFKLIVPDLPGSGASGAVDDMSMENLAEAIHTIIHEENIEACPVIGHSMGGYVALALTEHYYNHVSALGLFHSTAYADTEEKKATRRKGIEFIRQHGAFEFLQTSSPNLFSPHTKETRPELVKTFIESLRSFSPDALIAYYEAMIARPDRTDVLERTQAPVLFVIGEHDNAVPPNDVLKQVHLPGRSFIHVLKQSGHMGMLEEREKSEQVLEEFLGARV
ncbi:MAG: alpha/beta hydrolase [Citrobacter freundii]|nr:MAG: alpha/beta hydrolase [Citrobacter freundii]